MPINIEYIKDNLGVTLHGEKKVSGKEIMTAQKQIYQDSRHPGLKYWITDVSDSEEFAPTFEDAKQIALLDIKASQRNPGLLVAIVASTDHQYAMSNMFKAFAHKSDSDISIFLNRELANEWISSRLNTSNTTFVSRVESYDRIIK